MSAPSLCATIKNRIGEWNRPANLSGFAVPGSREMASSRWINNRLLRSQFFFRFGDTVFQPPLFHVVLAAISQHT